MHDDIIWGVSSGLLGNGVARFLARFRYVTVFAAVIIAIYGMGFVGAIRAYGLHSGAKLFLSRLLTPVGVLVPIGCGLLAIGIAFIVSIGTGRRREP